MTESEILGMKGNILLQEIITRRIARCAVPLFYIMSGFLFFQNVNRIGDVLAKLKKRVRTVLVPFAIATIFYVVFMLSMEAIPGVSNYINDHSIRDHIGDGVLKVMRFSFVAAPSSSQPWAFHLWFMRDLVLIMMITPVLLYVKKSIITTLLLLGGLYALSIITSVPSFVVSLLWFVMGVFLKNFSVNRTYIYIISTIFILISVLEFTANSPLWANVQIPVIFLGVAMIWNLYDIIVPKSFNLDEFGLLRESCKYTFFIYLFHEPAFNIFRKIMVILIGKTPLGFGITYLIAPWGFGFVMLTAGILMKKFFPRIYGICVGGR